MSADGTSSPGGPTRGTAPTAAPRTEAAGTPPEADPHAGGLGGRATWTLADQAVSSLSNAGLSILVARSVGIETFGSFSVVLLVFSFTVGLSRTLVTDPLVIRFSAAAPSVRRRATAEAAGAAIGLGLVGSAACGLAGLVLGGTLGAALWALAAVLPLILVQDTWRYAFFAGSRPAAATANDVVWTVLQFAAVGALLLAGRNTVTLLVLAWGASAGVAAVVGCFQAGVRPRPFRGPAWVRTHHDLATRLAADYVINIGAVYTALLLIGSILGIAAIGAIRAAQVLLGPLQLVISGITAFALPVFSRRVAAGASVLRPAALTAAVMTSISSVWVMTLLLLPDAVGQELLGETWDRAREVLPALSAMMLVLSLTVGASLGLRSLGRSDLLLRTTLVQAPLIVVLTCVGVVAGGLSGAAAGLALAHVAGMVLLWLSLRRTAAASARA